MFAVLEFTDFCFITLIVVLFAGGGAAASSYLQPSERKRLKRLEMKVDLLLKHFQLSFQEPSVAPWQELASDPNKKIEAVKAYREQTGAGLAEAKDAVENYIRQEEK